MFWKIVSYLFICTFFIFYLTQVQAVAWNHHVPQVLLSGSFDRTIVLVLQKIYLIIMHTFQGLLFKIKYNVANFCVYRSISSYFWMLCLLLLKYEIQCNNQLSFYLLFFLEDNQISIYHFYFFCFQYVISKEVILQTKKKGKK